jgi:2-alkyl-3-oxoalkanoate reductase
MKVFITGGSGFLGKNLITRLVVSGHEVCGLARSKESARVQNQLGARTLTGSLEDLDLWSGDLNSFDVVIHCAAPMEFWGSWDKFYSGITKASLDLAAAANRAEVKRFIYISSESVLQNVSPLLNVDETYPYPKRANSFYGQAKRLAEDGLRQLDGKMEIIILRPTFIWGEGSEALAKIISKAKSGKFPWVDNGEAEFEAVHVDNVVHAILKSLDEGSDRSIYFITDDVPYTVRSFFEGLFKAKGINLPKLNIPGSLLKLVAAILESMWKIFGITSPPPVSRFEWAFLGMPRRYNISKAKVDLGYAPQNRN